MKYYEILPLTITGPAEQVFTYESAEPLALGALVSVPLRNRKIRGLVTGEVVKPKFKTRPVGKILSEEPVLTEIQIKLARQISEYYLTPLGDTIAAILSFDFGKKRRLPKNLQPLIYNLKPNLKLTVDQKKIFDEIKVAKPASKHLVFGVTGSGKTEIYLQLVAEALKKGQTAIVLVPEISLTPQTMDRFQERFGDTVAVWHSHLLETEKFATWQQIISGQKKIVLGARSAIFAPLPNLGYIIIDEEHESSYKQDQTPRYETGQVAEWLTDLSGAKLVLGSATPKIETFYKTETGLYDLHTLSKRIVQDSMPPVKVVDLADEYKKGNKSIFSDDLYEATAAALKDKKQVLLFVNRRGAATFIVCRDCGHVMECPNCEIPLTYHPSEGELLSCHHCGYDAKVPIVCPNCKSHAIRYFGLGTQKVETEATKMFPKARLARMDRDTTKKRGSHAEIYRGFARNDFDILIGTQLIAKGWDLPNVSVVGVVSADTMLNLPDFKSGEKTFSLLTQVSGRTGRGYHPGRVVVQTYAPENYAILSAAKHDYMEFYRREIKERQKYNFPPFASLIKLTFTAKNEKTAVETAAEMRKLLSAVESESVLILGPNPAFIPKMYGNYREQIIIKILKSSEIKKVKEFLAKNYKSGLVVDIDPENLL